MNRLRLVLSSALGVAVASSALAQPIRMPVDAAEAIAETGGCVGCDLTDVRVRFDNYDGVDFTDATMVNFIFRQSSGVGTVFAAADLSEAGFVRSTVSEADFNGASLVMARFVDTNAREASFVGADMQGMTITGSILNGADLTAANLSAVSFANTGLAGANLTDANLTNAVLETTDLSEAILCRTTMPDGSIANQDCA